MNLPSETEVPFSTLTLIGTTSQYHFSMQWSYFENRFKSFKHSLLPLQMRLNVFTLFQNSKNSTNENILKIVCRFVESVISNYMTNWSEKLTVWCGKLKIIQTKCRSNYLSKLKKNPTMRFKTRQNLLWKRWGLCSKNQILNWWTRSMTKSKFKGKNFFT
jgi:hypothetical protein